MRQPSLVGSQRAFLLRLSDESSRGLGGACRGVALGALLGAVVLGVGCKKSTPQVDPTEDSSTAQDAPQTGAEPASTSSDRVGEREIADAVAQLTVRSPEAARRARDVLVRAIANDPDNAYLHYNLGLAQHQLQSAAEAERAFREAIRLDPALGRAHMGLGLLFEERGQRDQAIEQYREGIASDPENMELRSAVIGALRRGGRHEQAIDEARSALAFNNKSLLVFNDLGLVYLDTGDLALARFVFFKAISEVEGARNSALIRSNFGWALYRDGERIKARLELEEAHRLDETYLPAQVYLAHLYLDDRNYADAVPLLEAASKKAPDNVPILLNLGIAYRGVERYPEAERAYKRALEAEQGVLKPHLNLGILYGDYLKDYPKALASFAKYIEGGGQQAELAANYVEGVEREQIRAERQREREEERRKREEERERRERLLRESEQQNPSGQPPADEPPADEPTPDPWGQQ